MWPLGPGDAILAGGTWLFSEPQPHVRRLVDITGLGWDPITLSDNGIELAATCTLAELSAAVAPICPTIRPDWAAAPLLHQCCTALLASFKIWGTATVGGNLCLSFPAGAMISLTSALDGELHGLARRRRRIHAAGHRIRHRRRPPTCWRPATCCARSTCPRPRCARRTAFRKLAPSPLGRSGVVVIGRRERATAGRSRCR